MEKVMSKAKALEKEFEELAERYSKLQRIRKLGESEILADFIKWNRCVLEELEKIKEKQAEFGAQVDKLMVRIFKLEVRTAMKEKDHKIMELGKNPTQDFTQDKL